jgi:RNA polymerase sigma factor (sigma-70 family)
MKSAVTSPAGGRPSEQVATLADMQPGGAATDPLRAALLGDRDAWDQIVGEHTKLLWWIARSHRLDDATAADVVQTVWLQLIRFGDRITDSTRLRSWLATTARRESVRRTSLREVPSMQVGDEIDRFAPDHAELLIDDETIGVVLAAFEALSSEDQQLLQLLCDVPPKSYREIAALLGKTPGYIGPTRQRALNRLRALLNDVGDQ